jgi:hypothetical protein
MTPLECLHWAIVIIVVLGVSYWALSHTDPKKGFHK